MYNHLLNVLKNFSKEKEMKIVLLVLMITIITGSLFAEVKIGAQIDMAITPFQFIYDANAAAHNKREALTRFMNRPELEEIVIGAGAGRFASGQGPRARLDMRASFEDIIGMRARIQVRTDGIGIEDFLQAWWTPIGGLRIDMGRFFNDSLRGKVNDMDERMNSYTVRMYDADSIFTRFRTHRFGGQAGLMLSYTHTIGDSKLFAGAMLYDLMPFTSSPPPGTIHDAHPEYVRNNVYSFHNVQAALAYTLSDQLQIRAQYVGAKPLVAINRVTDRTIALPFTYEFDVFSIIGPRIEAAAAFTGIPNLTLDIGGKLPLAFRDWERTPDNIFEKENESLLSDMLYRIYKNNFIWQAPYQVSIGVLFEAGDFGLGLKTDVKFGGSVRGTRTEMHFPLEINAHIWPSYDFGFATIAANFGFEYIGATYNGEGQIIQHDQPRPLNGGNRIGAGLSIQKNITESCIIKGGIGFKWGAMVNGVQEKTVVSIPLFIDWSF
jgi:hypothetical protein